MLTLGLLQRRLPFKSFPIISSLHHAPSQSFPTTPISDTLAQTQIPPSFPNPSLLTTYRGKKSGKIKRHKSFDIGRNLKSDYDVFGDLKKDHTFAPNPNKSYRVKKQGFLGWGPRMVNIKLTQLRKMHSPTKLLHAVSEKSQDFHALNVQTAWNSFAKMPRRHYGAMVASEKFQRFLAETTIRMRDYDYFFGDRAGSYCDIISAIAKIGVHPDDAREIIGVVVKKGPWIVENAKAIEIGKTAWALAE
jgi:hypothetical protein